MVIILTLRRLRQEDLDVHCETLSPFKEIKKQNSKKEREGVEGERGRERIKQALEGHREVQTRWRGEI